MHLLDPYYVFSKHTVDMNSEIKDAPETQPTATELLELVRIAVKAKDFAQAEIHILKVRALIYPNGRG